MAASKAQQAQTADRRKQAIALRLAGMDWQTIADRLEYSSRGAACQDVSRALAANIAEQAANAEVHRETELQRLDQELQRLDALYVRVQGVMDREHVTVSNGRVVDLHGDPIPDDGPILAAADRLIRIEDARRRNGERRAKLLGLDAPQAMEVGINDLDREIAAIERRLASTQGKADKAAAPTGTES